MNKWTGGYFRIQSVVYRFLISSINQLKMMDHIERINKLLDVDSLLNMLPKSKACNKQTTYITTSGSSGGAL